MDTPGRTPSGAAQAAPSRPHADDLPFTEGAHCAAASREKFDRYVAEHREVLVRHARWLCGDHHLADDLVQEASLATWRRVKARSISVGELKKQYLTVAVRNAFFDHLRKLRAEKKRDHRVGVTPEHLLDGDPGERLWLDNDEITRARALLPSRHWEIYVLTEAYGFTAREIAERIRLAEGTVRNYLSSARSRIQAGFA